VIADEAARRPRVLVTGSAGFIGYHLSRLLIDEGFEVLGYDAMSDYYDVGLKRRRHAMLLQSPRFRAVEGRLEDRAAFDAAVDPFAPEVIVHLAGQAGVRYSIEQPLTYLESNVVGTLSVMEAARRHGVAHLLMASTSSVYGAIAEMPFAETQKADTQLTIYAATKKATESMGHAWAHLWGVPITMFRFFTVYGPWGRPDMALFKFVEATLEGRPIDVYNGGEMWRDFTYVDDLVRGIRLLMDVAPPAPDAREPAGSVPEGDSLSPAAPFRIVNIGNGESVRLSDFVDAVEAALGVPAVRNLLPMQPGDLPATWADASLLRRLTGYAPRTDVRDGVRAFVDWYRDWKGLPRP
jgi:UDP-glucuronate 4-epimerase